MTIEVAKKRVIQEKEIVFAMGQRVFVVLISICHLLISVDQVCIIWAYSGVKLNLSISFLGCVRLKYLSADEGIALNVSYGESLLHNEIIKGPDPEPSCLNIFAKLAQLCARFHGLLPTDDGMRGCIHLEPMLLGEPQLELPIGCFRMGPNGMQVVESPVEVIKEQQPIENAELNQPAGNGTAEGPESLAGYSAEDILAAVNESAETGIAIISNWLGLGANATEEAESSESQEDQTQQQQPVQQQILPQQETQQNSNFDNQNGNSGLVVFG